MHGRVDASECAVLLGTRYSLQFLFFLTLYYIIVSIEGYVRALKVKIYFIFH